MKRKHWLRLVNPPKWVIRNANHCLPFSIISDSNCGCISCVWCMFVIRIQMSANDDDHYYQPIPQFFIFVVWIEKRPSYFCVVFTSSLIVLRHACIRIDLQIEYYWRKQKQKIPCSMNRQPPETLCLLLKKLFKLSFIFSNNKIQQSKWNYPNYVGFKLNKRTEMKHQINQSIWIRFEIVRIYLKKKQIMFLTCFH